MTDPITLCVCSPEGACTSDGQPVLSRPAYSRHQKPEQPIRGNLCYSTAATSPEDAFTAVLHGRQHRLTISASNYSFASADDEGVNFWILRI